MTYQEPEIVDLGVAEDVIQGVEDGPTQDQPLKFEDGV